MAVVNGCGGAVATSTAVGQAVDVDALQLLADVGKLGVGTVRRGLGPAAKMRIVPFLHPYDYFALEKNHFNEWLLHYSIWPIILYRMVFQVEHYLVLTVDIKTKVPTQNRLLTLKAYQK